MIDSRSFDTFGCTTAAVRPTSLPLCFPILAIDLSLSDLILISLFGPKNLLPSHPQDQSFQRCILPYDKPIHPSLLSLTKPCELRVVELATRITGGQSG